MSGLCVVVDLADHPVDPNVGRRMASFPGRLPLQAQRHGFVLQAHARLDNREELVAALVSHLPGSGSPPADTDLILAAFLEWGERCPGQLLGDFAFALWDPTNRSLFCARDPLGVKPLCYSRIGSLVCVASEPRQILEHPAVPRDVDLTTLGDYLTRLPSDPERTFFRHIHHLPPGHCLTATEAGTWVERYWDVDPDRRIVFRRDEEYAERFLELFRQSVKDRLRTSSGTVGIALSGGLDSCSVAAVAQQELAQIAGAPKLLASSFVFDRLVECDERPYIRALAEATGIETAFIEAERFWFLGDPEAYTPSLDTPMMSWESCFRQMLTQVRQRDAEVLLTGHGADDLLRGSAFVYSDRLQQGDLRVFGEVWKLSRSRKYGWRPLYRHLLKPLLPRRTDLALRRLLGRQDRTRIPAWISPTFARQTGLAERVRAFCLGSGQRNARTAMYENLVRRPGYTESADWYDRNATPFGIEVRHPFLDRRLFEFVLAIPPRQLFQLGTYKPLLRRAMRGILPESVRLRTRKTGLGPFVDFSLQRKEAERIAKLFDSPISASLGILEGEALRTVFERYRTEEPDESLRTLWCAVTVECWLRRSFGQPSENPWEISSPREAA